MSTSGRITTNGGVTVITDTVAPGTLSEILQVNECSGGHVLPGNFLSRFTITTTDSTGTHEVYTGVNDADWQETGSPCGRKVLVLGLTSPAEPRPPARSATRARSLSHAVDRVPYPILVKT
ncbi:MAG: hypothetical protein ABI599_15515 [Flavobacteriales bacterium]